MTLVPEINGERLLGRLDAFARIGATPAGGVNRQAFSVEDRDARRLLAELALRCERALVQSDGLPWPVYDRFCARWVKRIGARKHYPNPPPDIELKPEIDEDDKATLRRMGAKRAAKSGRDSLR